MLIFFHIFTSFDCTERYITTIKQPASKHAFTHANLFYCTLFLTFYTNLWRMMKSLVCLKHTKDVTQVSTLKSSHTKCIEKLRGFHATRVSTARHGERLSDFEA